MQSNGTGDVATIIRGIDYASANGADVISMSIGGYGYSIAEEQALGRAYATSVLVAAAGNDNRCIYQHDCEINNKKALENKPVYPAALSFVLGVEASSDVNGSIASFSNFDEDGPIYSTYEEAKLYNYELRAPGTGIYSTFPSGRYKSLNGTSMACPLVAGAISRLIQCKFYGDEVNKELLFGDLIKSRGSDLGNIDMLYAYNCNDSTRQPDLQLVGTSITDTIVGDGDGRYDAGETIELYATIRNTSGIAQNIKYWVKFGLYVEGAWIDEDTTLYNFINDTAMFGWTLNSYAKNIAANPVRFTLSNDVADGSTIKMTIFAICDNMADTMVQTVEITVENGVEIGGMVTQNLTLYPNVHYIVTSNLAVPSGVTLTIKPGAKIQFKDNTGISVNASGNFIAEGNADSMIVFTKADNCVGYFSINLASTLHSIQYAAFEYCNWLHAVHGGSISNCLFQYCSSDYLIEDANLYKCALYFNHIDNQQFQMIHNNVVGTSGEIYMFKTNDLKNCNIIGNDVGFEYYSDFPEIQYASYPSYWGSSIESIARRQIQDINSGWGYGHYDLSNRLLRPDSIAHGIVWKVLIDGWDAQDQFDSLPPLGIGTHQCKVYFNRPMDIEVAPNISYGVRAPYLQHSISTNGSWSADSTIYTAYFTIGGKTMSDGLNRIYVSGAKDNEHFEIPVENTRFNMNIQASGSMSTGLMAEAGLGKVKLTWETDEEDFEDLLGYNIFRWTDDTIRWNDHYDYNTGQWVEAGWRVDTTIVNAELIDAADTAFIDYNVIPGKSYYYVIKQMTTSLDNYSISNPVTATPLTAQKGDANGSMSVDVADVITEVTYMIGGNPAPFIFEAADVNDDGVIDVLDVIKTVSIIANPGAASQAVNNDPVYYYFEDGKLYVESDVVLGGVQFKFNGDSATTVITPLSTLDEMEKVGLWQNSSKYFFMAYSMSGKTLLPGTHALLEFGDAELSEIVLSDATGNNVAAIEKLPTSLSTIECVQMMKCYPNPFKNEINIQYVVGRSDANEVEFVMTDITGRTIATKRASASYGGSTLNWRLDNELMPGVYFVTLMVDGKKIQTEKVICQK